MTLVRPWPEESNATINHQFRHDSLAAAAQQGDYLFGTFCGTVFIFCCNTNSVDTQPSQLDHILQCSWRFVWSVAHNSTQKIFLVVCCL